MAVIPLSKTYSFHTDRIARLAAGLAIAMLATACARAPANLPPDVPFDPYEGQNREIHKFNKALDRALVRPVGAGYSSFVPDDIETGIGRFSENLSLPGSVVNNILQMDMVSAAKDTSRFLVNSTVGLAGVFDPATEMGLAEPSDADFGQTLHVWGAREGAYVELPVLGPSTERDTYGLVVDLFTNPLSYILPSPGGYISTGATLATRLSSRSQFADTIDAILYESADSYAQSRSVYLQRRDFELSDGGSDDFEDPYGDQ